MRTLSTMLFICVSVALSAQPNAPLAAQAPIAIADVSAEGSPVTLTGTLSFDAKNAVFNVTGQNQTSQGIMAFLVTIDALPLISYREEHDHFFKQVEVTPHSSFSISGGPIEFPLGTETINGRPAKSVAFLVKHAEARTVWVQFEDGSTWGDATAGDAVMAERVETKAFLLHLLDIQKQSGDSAFVKALSAPQRSGSISESLSAVFRHLQQLHGTAALVDHIKQRLEIGASRATN